MSYQDTLQKMATTLSEYIPEYVLDYLPKSVTTRMLLFGTTAGILSYMLFRRKHKLPPGPYRVPIIGSKILVERGNLPQKVTDMGKKYGSIFTIYIGSDPCVILNDLESINEALIKKGAHTSDRFSFYLADMMFHNGEDIIMGRYGTGWKLRRKIASRAIRLFMVSGKLNVKIEEAVSKTVTAMLKEKGPFDPKPYLFYTTLNIIGGMCFSASYEFDDPEYIALLKNLEDTNKLSTEELVLENFITFFARHNIFKTAKCKKIKELADEFFSFVTGHVDRHRANFKPGEIHDFTDCILQAEQEIAAEGENMADFNPIHVSLICSDIYFAGNDTSRQTLLWSLMYAIGIPGVQQKIQAEVDLAVGNGRYPSTEDRNNLPYADAVLHEALRKGPIAPLGVPHKTSCDITLGKYDIPKGTMLMTNIYALHNDPDFWSEPEKFLPERFLDEAGKMAPKPDNWLPFSAGRRVCLGEPLAKPELHLILSALFQQLEFLPEPGTQVNTEPSLKGVQEVPKPFKIIVRKRH